MSEQFVLAQISDTHIRTDDGGAAVKQLRLALAGARAYDADAIIITGDLANDERAEEYAELARALIDPPAPLFLLPGNHDDRARLRAAFPHHNYLPRAGNLSFAIDEFPIRLVALDQVTPGETYGVFTPELGDWLEQALSARPHQPTLIALHHPPFPTHDLLFDTIALRESAVLAEIVARHPQVMRVVCGHHHRVAVGQIAHAPVIVAPSTSWVYGLALREDQQIAPKTDERPGWMLHIWKRDGGMASHFMGL